MKKAIVLCALVLATACATTPSTEDLIPVDVVQGQNVHLWGVIAERTPDGAEVFGYAARSQTRNELVSEHLHVETIGIDGQILQFNPVPWNSAASLRSRKSASFQASFGPESASLIRIRLTVVPGTIHKDGQ